MRNRITRRSFHQTASAIATTAIVGSSAYNTYAQDSLAVGVVRGEPTADKIGQEVLAAGGNVVDAIVAAALTAAVVAHHQTGIGGYGGHAILALDGGRHITSIDFNS